MANLDSLKKAVLYRDSSHAGGETLVVAAHVQQLAQWIIRQGLKFYPLQDDGAESRRKKIDEVIEKNKLDLYYEGIVSLYLIRGGILWYLRPTGGEDYEIHWFAGGDPNEPETEYKAYYKPGGRKLQEVIIRYSYDDFSSQGSQYYSGVYPLDRKKWVRLRITAHQIIEETYTTMPSLFPDGYMAPNQFNLSTPVNRTVLENSLRFIPCVESPNHPLRPGDSGHGEFDWLKNQIEAEDSMRSSMLDNVFLFGNPTLVSTRSVKELIEAEEKAMGGRPTWSQQQGYYSMTQPSTRRDDPWVRGGRYGQGMDWSNRKNNIKRIIGGVLPEERFGYIFPDPINGDQWRFVQEYREGIHECLGGIDPLGMRSGMTFGEVKSLYGKVAATALKKCKSLWTFGLAKLLEMVIYVEEQTFLLTYKNYLLNGHPKKRTYRNMVKEMGDIPDSEVLKDYSNNNLMMPPGVVGLAPFGDRKVNWKWTGPVFENSPRDQLDLSIGVRNYQELGLGSLESMQYLFPDKEPKELKAMLTGVPFRFISSVSNSIATLLGLQQQMMGIPDPQNPSLPLASRFDLTPLISQQLTTLYREISYGAQFNPDDTNGELSSSGLQPALHANSSDNTYLLPNLSTGLLPNPGGSSNATPELPTQQRSPIPDGQGWKSGSVSAYAAGLYPNAGIPTRPTSTSMANSARSYPSAEWEKPIPNPGGATLNAGVNPSSNSSPISNPVPIPDVLSGIPTDILSTPSLLPLYLQQPVETNSRGKRPKSSGKSK